MNKTAKSFAKALEERRANYPWEFEGLDDWSTEEIFSQLTKLGINTEPERFPEQAALSGGFRKLEDEWVNQMPEELRKNTLWPDFPLFAVPVLWERLAPHVICADLIEQHLYDALSAEDAGKPLPEVNGLPASIAAAMELTRFLQAVPPEGRAARFFNAFDEGRDYDYAAWILGLLQDEGSFYPDEFTQIADVMSDCRDRPRFQAEIAAALSAARRAGRGHGAHPRKSRPVSR
jgi:hypothetical protein